MKISYKWLKEFIDTDHSPEKVAEILTQTGLEVEGLEKIELIKGGLEGVYTGEVISCEQHPNADRLKVTTVDVGHEKLQIVCGAPNIKIGQKVPVATVGTTLYPKPDEPFKIKKSKIRGVESFGMICAEDELGIGNSHDGIMVLNKDVRVGKKASDLFKLESDYQLEIGLTPNRADAMGHIGVARDLKAYLNVHENQCQKINFHQTDDFDCKKTTLDIDIQVENTSACPIYYGTTISDVSVEDSPEWLKQKLIAIGLNPINNVVDVTNYVMYEYGTPLHAFDADCLNGKIVVKNATKGSEFKTLDGVTHQMKDHHLMITNGKENLCIAGVFGGENSGITNKTKNIFLECAYFDPTCIRKTAKDLGLNTDASFRFERGIDSSSLTDSIKRASLLIQELTKGKISMPVKCVGSKLDDFKTVNFNPNKARTLIGTDISDELIKQILKELEIDICSSENDNWKLNVPSYRVDVNRHADVVEEVLRIYGFNKVEIPNKLNTSIPSFSKPDLEKVKENISNMLVAKGYFEVLNNSLSKLKYLEFDKESSSSIHLLNPLSQDLEVMRKSLVFGLLENINYNFNRQQNKVEIFEFGKVYEKNNDKYQEQEKLSIALGVKKADDHWIKSHSNNDFFSLKSITESIFHKLGLIKFLNYKTLQNTIIKNGIEVFINKNSVGYLGYVSNELISSFNLKNDVFIAELNWDEIVSNLKLNKVLHKELPKTFSVRRDLSLLLNKGIYFSEIQKIAFKNERKLLKEVNLFDVYEGKNIDNDKKSYSVSFIIQNFNETMTDKQIESIMNKIQAALNKELGAELR